MNNFRARDYLAAIAITCGFVFLCSALFTPAEILSSYSESFVVTTFTLAQILIISSTVGIILALIAIVWRYVSDSVHTTQIRRIERTKASREAHTTFNVIKHNETGVLTIFGSDGLPRESHQLATPVWQPVASKIETIEPPLLPEPKRDLFPLLARAERRVIGGPSGAGKTTVLKMLLKHGVNSGRKPLFISPHEESEILPGIPVAGIGRNYSEIESVLQALIDLMTLRYVDVAEGRYKHFGHDGVDIFIDEWTGIRRQVKTAGDMLGTLITEVRKVNMSLTVLTHSLNVDTLGVDSNLRQSMLLTWLDGGVNKPYTASTLSFDLTGKKEVTDYAHPADNLTQFDYVPPSGDFIVDIPPSEVSRAVTLSAQGFNLSDIYREIKGKPKDFKPSGQQRAEVKRWINHQI